MAILCLTLAGTPDLRAQDYAPVPVTVSRSTVSIDGKSYYAHIVLERQTIYGITKAYDVTEEVLYSANPLLKENGLKSGTVIYIPVDKKAVQETARPQTVVTKPKDKAETEKEAVVAKSGPRDVKEAFPDKEGFVKHTVKWFEDIYDVAKQYGVTPQDIMDANGLKSSRISKRQVLYVPILSDEEKARRAAAAVKPPTIPVIEDPVIADQGIGETQSFDPIRVEQPEVAPMEKLDKDKPVEGTAAAEEKEEEGILDWLAGKGNVEMALILPFNAAGKVSETNMDFYSGVLLALRDLETEGVKTKLNVYDLQAGLPASFELEKNDFVLGPVTAADLSTVLERTEGRTTVISPLDQRAASHTQGHANFIQAPSSARNQYEDLAAWAAQDLGKADRIILVTEKVTGSTAPASGVREALLNAGISFQGVSLGQGETRSLPSSLTSQLTKGGENRIIVASEKETFVADMVRNLGILRGRGYDIVMYAPSRVRTFDSVEPNAYHQCSLHISSSYFVDYADTRVKSFVRTYRALFKTEPSQFAFQGYDTARYFVSLVSKYGPHWTKAISRETGKGLHTDFRFEAVPGGAFRNTAVRRIVYNTDYTTELDR